MINTLYNLAITGGLFLVLLAVLAGVLMLLPNYALPDGVANAVRWVIQVLVDFDFIIPITTLFNLVSLILKFEIALLLIRALLWLYDMVCTVVSPRQ